MPLRYRTYIGWRRACRAAVPEHQVIFEGTPAGASAYIEYKGFSEIHRIDVGRWDGKPGVVETPAALPLPSKPFPTFPVPACAPPGTFAIDPDDDMIALANTAGRDPWLDPKQSTCVELTAAGEVGVVLSDFKPS
jgi:hypothetical protein